MADNKLKRVQKSEVAFITRSSHLSAYPVYGGARVRPKDENLINHGHSRAYEIYRDLLRDPHVYAVTQKRWLAVVGREWELIPASDRRIDKKARDLVEAQLQALGSYDEEMEGSDLIPNLFSGFDQVCYNLLRGEFYGFRPGEIIWDTDGKEIVAKQVKDKASGRFVYLVGKKGYLFRLLTNEAPTLGVPLPAKKFIIHTHHAEDDNPYGWGLGARCFYPTLWKRELARFSLIYADKYGTPTGKATYPEGRKDLVPEIEERINALAQEANIILPANANFEWLTLSGQGTNLYVDLMDYFDREISKAVLGETGSTDQQGSGGSRARDQVGNDVRIEIAKASADLLNDTLYNSLIKWVVWYNFGDRAKPPKLIRKFPELEEKEDLGNRASRDRTLSELMERKPTLKYIEDTYGIEFEEPEADTIQSRLDSIFGSPQPENNRAGESLGENSDQGVPADQPEFREESLDFAAKKIIDWNGLSIGVEYLDGDSRHGKVLAGSYGHIRGHKGADGEALDCYLAPGVVEGNRDSDRIFRVAQLDAEGDFDEFKFMLGYPNKLQAKKAYLAVIPNARFGSIRESSISEIKNFDKAIARDQASQITEEAIELALPEMDKMRRRIGLEVNRVNNLSLSDTAKFSKLQENLYSLYNELNSDRYAEILGNAIAANQLAGIYETTQNED